MSGIIPTPSHGVIIGSLPLADADNRKSMRIPVDTLENGWESYELKSLLATIASMQSSIASLQARKLEEWMPVGHIYVQLPSLPEPGVIYPRATWANISSSYTGSFFRVEGGNAASFGVHQDESVPNITGGYITRPYSTANGSARNIAWITVGAYAETTGTTGNTSIIAQSGDYTSTTVQINFDASRSHGAYGRRNEVAPRNYAIRIWRKTGTISGTRSYALIDDDSIYQQTVELQEDEAGIIGHNPHIHIDTPPSKAMATRHAKASHEVLRYHRERKAWESVEDHRGRTAYHIDGSGSRIIHQLGDTLAEGETWDAPEPIVMT